MKKIILMLSFVFVLFGFNDVYALSENITQINFTSTEQSIDINTNSGVLSVQTQNILGEREEVSESGVKLNVTSNSSTGEFSSSDTNWIPISIFGMNNGWGNRNFYYKDITPGTYTITVSAEEKSWISATQEIVVKDNSIIPDTTLPIITLIGDPIINLKVGDVYVDAGATALDDVDLDITSSITIGGTYLNTLVAGNYIITYDVKDNAGNSAVQIIRTINIEEVTNGGGNGGNNNSNFTAVKDIILPNNCSIADTNNKIHTFPQENSASKFLGICALSEMKKESGVDSFEIIEYPFGLFIDSINNLKDPSSAYWALYLNDVYENRGLTDLPLVGGDKMSLVYVDFNGVGLGSRVDINISSLEQEEEIRSSGGGSSHKNNKDFSLENALSFLSLQQKDDGSFGDYLYTDWVAMGIAHIGSEADSLKAEIINYFKNTPLLSDTVTDNERHVMALMALGVDPYIGTEVNYIKKIVDSFDGEQFGDKDLVNDDIFAIIPLLKSGYTKDDEIIKKDINFIIGKQDKYGSWGSVDMTGAGIVALKNFTDIDGVKDAISKAEEYLKNEQDKDGGFDNSFSTSWAIQGLSLNDSYSDEVKMGIEYLANNQKEDGGLDNGDINTRIWSTSYAVPVIFGKNWNNILVDFKKPEIIEKIVKLEEKNDLLKEIKIETEIKEVLNDEEIVLNREEGIYNNLGASASNVIKENISINRIVDNISNLFVYIGKGFYGILVFLGESIVNIFN